MNVIDVKNLSYSYPNGLGNSINVIKNVNFSVKRGEIVSIIGHTGSGKSTLVQIINGILKPTSGNVYLYGKDIWKNYKNMQDVHFKIGLSFQYPENQLFAKNVYNDIAYGPTNQGLSDDKIKEAVYSSIEFLGINKDILYKSPFELSGGEKRKVAIAGVVAMNPDVLILDEPTAGLDYFGRKFLLDFVIKYNKVGKKTIILVTHFVEDAAMISDRILVINDGVILFYDTPKKIFLKAAKLREIGLSRPEVTKLADDLYNYGFSINREIVDLDSAETEMVRLIENFNKN